MLDRTSRPLAAACARPAAALAAALLVSFAAGGSAEGADACPNAVLRAEQDAAALPDCRAYEMVSPVAKNDYGVAWPAAVGTSFQAAPGGGAVLYRATGGFPGDTSSLAGSVVRSIRSDAGWSSPALEPPQSPYWLLIGTGVLGVSEDLSSALVLTQRALAPGAVEGESNFYVRDNLLGSYRFVASAPGMDLPSAGNTGDPHFVGATPDFSRVVFSAPAALTPDAAPGGVVNIYEWDGSSLRLVSVLPGETVSPTGAARRFAYSVSLDGTRILFGGGAGDELGVYLRIRGGESVRVTDSQRTIGGGQSATPIVAGVMMSRDGGTVHFTSNEGLTDASDTNDRPTLYRYDVASGALTDETASHDPGDPSGADVRTILGASEDGSSVYFTAGGVLATGATAGESNLYVRNGGVTRLIAVLDAGETILGNSNGGRISPWDLAAVSPNGRHLVFTASSSLLPEIANPAGHALIYRYDADTGALACLSCPGDGSPVLADASISSGISDPIVGNDYSHRSVLDDGRAFFETGDELTPRDTNGRRDVYVDSVSGGPQLISTGGGTSDAFFADASPDGRDVFVVTRGRLVPTDVDAYPDVYDVRVGGGIPAQNVRPPLHVACSDGCQGPLGTPPALVPPGSQDAEGHAAPAPRPAGRTNGARPRVSRTKTAIGSTARLSVRLPGPGRLRITGRGLRTATRRIGRAGIHRIAIVLTRDARRSLQRRRRLRSTARLAFTPRGAGRTGTATVRLTFKAAR